MGRGSIFSRTKGNGDSGRERGGTAGRSWPGDRVACVHLPHCLHLFLSVSLFHCWVFFLYSLSPHPSLSFDIFTSFHFLFCLSFSSHYCYYCSCCCVWIRAISYTTSLCIISLLSLPFSLSLYRFLFVSARSHSTMWSEPLQWIISQLTRRGQPKPPVQTWDNIQMIGWLALDRGNKPPYQLQPDSLHRSAHKTILARNRNIASLLFVCSSWPLATCDPKGSELSDTYRSCHWLFPDMVFIMHVCEKRSCTVEILWSYTSERVLGTAHLPLRLFPQWLVEFYYCSTLNFSLPASLLNWKITAVWANCCPSTHFPAMALYLMLKG